MNDTSPPAPKDALTPHRAYWFPLTRNAWSTLVETAVEAAYLMGCVVRNCQAMLGFFVRGRIHPGQTLRQAAVVCWDTLGIALILTTFTGMVLALQTAAEMTRQGAGNFVGALVAMALVRELAPIMTGFSVIALAGSAFAAELGSMTISNQVDALRMLRVDPLRYLVLPRVVATTLALPCMVVITCTAGIVGGMWVSGFIAELPADLYLESVRTQTDFRDVFCALLKSASFGFALSLITTTIGLETRGGAREVGESTTQAVVWSFVAMAALDYVLTYLIYGSG
ncbi:MAG: ABC transporter permease [Candidatus Melainabacteria bacterium]|nr:ABC transporter permease [Candidatus Melainabacteria bacterium]